MTADTMIADTTSSWKAYNKKIHRIGIISSIILIVSLMAVPISIMTIYNAWPDSSALMASFLSVLMFFIPGIIIEFISYAPILGAGGQYLAFITGNISNMKLPAAISGLNVAGVEAGTPEADAVATISVAVSSLVTTAILVVGMIVGSQLLPLLNSPVLQPAFNNLMPAIMGALAIPIILKDPKTASLPCALVIIITVAMGGYTAFSAISYYLMPVFLVLSVVWSYFLYKRKGKKEESK